MNSKETVGILVPSDDAMPSMPIQVDGYETLKALVGGYMDTVTRELSAEDIGADAGNETSSFVAVGYVHDEGLLIGLGVNRRATTIFGRKIVGDVVIVNGSNHEGRYDGDTYSVPEWFVNRMSDGSLEATVEVGTAISEMIASAIEYCTNSGHFTVEQTEFALSKMDEVIAGKASELDEQMVTLFFSECARLYAMHRMGIDETMMDILHKVAEHGVSDDELRELLEGGE
jgi:hypothetical protein